MVVNTALYHLCKASIRPCEQAELSPDIREKETGLTQEEALDLYMVLNTLMSDEWAYVILCFLRIAPPGDGRDPESVGSNGQFSAVPYSEKS